MLFKSSQVKFSVILSLFVSSYCFAGPARAEMYTKIACDSVGVLSSTDDCFIGGTVYQSENRGIGDITVQLVNYNNDDVVWYPTDPEGNSGYSYDAQTLQAGTRWYLDEKIFYFPPSITDWQWSSSQLPFRGWSVNKSKLLAKSKPGLGLRLLGVSGNVDRSKPAFRLTSTTRLFRILTRNDGSRYRDKLNPILHKSHMFFYPAWCGDGVVNSKHGERCDSGAENGKSGQCSATCN